MGGCAGCRPGSPEATVVCQAPRAPPARPQGVGRALEGFRFWGHKTLVALGTGRLRCPAASSHGEPEDCSPEPAPCVVPRLGGLSRVPPTHGTSPSTRGCPVGRGEPGTPCTVPAGAGSCPRAGVCTCVHARVLARVSARVRARCASASRPRARGQDGTQQAQPFPTGCTGDDGRCAGRRAAGAAWGGGRMWHRVLRSVGGRWVLGPAGLNWGRALGLTGVLLAMLGAPCTLYWAELGASPDRLGALQWLCCRQGRGPR